MSNKAGQYIWFDKKDLSRNPYAVFRKNFHINNIALLERVKFHIFADTVYTLYVNGNFLGFGPVRFDPRYPQYDSYDLSQHLREGDNVIAVLVNFNGHKVFKSIPAQAAMIAWGEVEVGKDVIDLCSDETWKCREHTAYSRFTAKMSFALPAQIYYDQGKFDEAWIQPAYDDKAWPDAVILSNQRAFGDLSPREIPFMELSPVSPSGISIRPLQKNEEIYSFYFPLPIGYDTAYDIQEGYSRFVCWSTYIYSPCAQSLGIGMLHEKLWINGNSCVSIEDLLLSLRYNAAIELKEGWNYLFAQVDANNDICEGYLALPKNRGLLLSADKNKDSGNLFRYMPLQPAELDKELRSLKLPLPEDALEEGDCHAGVAEKINDVWIYTTAADSAANPCREVSWDNYLPPLETLNALAGFTVRKDLYPDGFSLIIDMEHMRLLFPCLQLQAVKGVTIDLLYGDRFGADGQHLRSLSWIPLGDRLVCANDCLDWQPIQPRGFRYLNITLRNTTADVKIKDICFLSAQYPLTKKGRFECSDPLLNRIWEMGALTQAIDMEDVYDDCIDRERGLYALDALIQYNVNLACYGDHALMKRSLELYGQSTHESGLFRCLYPNEGDYIITDFCLYIVNAFHAYYLQTGDKELLEQYWPAIIKNLQVFHRLSDERDDLLLCADKPEGNWPSQIKDNLLGFWGDGDRVDNTGINCVFSSHYLLALRNTLEMAQSISKDDVQDLTRRINILEKSIPEKYWNEEKGLYADNLSQQSFSPHASLMALQAGIVSKHQRERLLKTLPTAFPALLFNGYDHSGGTLFETAHGYYLVDALYKIGLEKLAEKYIKEGWGYMLCKGLKTTAEHFDLIHSQCHAWSAYPTYMMSHYVLGISFDADCDNIRVSPQPGSLSWAAGVFPHPKGLVEVAWHTEDGQIIFDRLLAPKGVEINVCP